MNLIQTISLGLVAGAGVALVVRSLRRRKITLDTLPLLPNESVVDEDPEAFFAYLPRPRGGSPRAPSASTSFAPAIVRITNERVIVARPLPGSSRPTKIESVIYRAPIPEGFGKFWDDGFASFVAGPSSVVEATVNDRSVIEIVAPSDAAFALERIWIDSKLAGRIRGFFGGASGAGSAPNP